MAREAFELNGQTVAAGTRAQIDIDLPGLNANTRLAMPVHVIHGRREGPVLFVSAAIHGDEINGIEIIRQLLELKTLRGLQGTLVAVPVVNVYGLIHQSRYLPDRRDLNRSFPGSETGSLTARVADRFMQEVALKCTHGIDLHTGAIHRSNLPQIRADLDQPETEKLARAFGVPVLLNASLRDGSLRQEAAEHNIPMLLYEAGEALRYNNFAIKVGVKGIINVMYALGMFNRSRRTEKALIEPVIARSSSWVRSPCSGLLRAAVPLGKEVKRNECLGYIGDPFSGHSVPVVASFKGVVIGRSEIPLVHEGEALFHIARFGTELVEAVEQLESFQQLEGGAPTSPAPYN